MFGQIVFDPKLNECYTFPFAIIKVLQASAPRQVCSLNQYPRPYLRYQKLL